MQQVDISEIIDKSTISGFQIRVFALCAMVVLLDGIDYQLIGIVAPKIAGELGVGHAALGGVMAAGPLGAAIGALSCGMIADRFGRQRTFAAATLLFGAFTFASSYSTSLTDLAILRFLTGLGLGGAVPGAIALASEYAPRRRRAAIVSLLWAAFPLGGMTGGLLNAYLVNVLDWRNLFELWGLIPFVVGLLLFVALPESAQFLTLRNPKSPALARIAQTISKEPAGDLVFVTHEVPLPGVPLRNIFLEGRTMVTASLWVILFVILGILTVLAVWTPALMTSLGYSISQGALVIAIHGFGSFVGTSAAGRAMERFGVVNFLVPVFLIAALTLLGFGLTSKFGYGALLAGGLATGVALGMANSCIVALSALTYPTSIRSTGVGWATSMGRFGAVVGPFLVATMIGVGADMTTVYEVLAALLLVTLPFVAQVARYARAKSLLGARREIPPRDELHISH